MSVNTSDRKTIFSEVTLMLLGSRGKLRLRQAIKEALVEKGYTRENIVVMEEIKDDEKFVNDKFGGILDKFSPKMFFALFHKEACMDGVIFELGWICGKYNSKQINERLRIVSDLDYDWKKTTRYIQSLFHTAQLLPIEKMSTELLSKCIHNNVGISLNAHHVQSIQE